MIVVGWAVNISAGWVRPLLPAAAPAAWQYRSAPRFCHWNERFTALCAAKRMLYLQRVYPAGRKDEETMPTRNEGRALRQRLVSTKTRL